MQIGKAELSANSPSLLSHLRSGVTALWKSVFHVKAPGAPAWDRDVGLQGSSKGWLVGKVLLLLEGSDFSHISTFSCFCAKTRLCVCCTVHQTETNDGNLPLLLPCCCCQDFFMEMPWLCHSHTVLCSQPASLVPQATEVQSIQHIYFPLGGELGML